MNIGFVGYFDPISVKEYFPDDINIQSENPNASSVNATVKGLLELGHNITVFTSYDGVGDVKALLSERVKIYMVPRNHKLKGVGLFRCLYIVRRLTKVIDDHISELDILHAQWTYEYAMAAKNYANTLPVFCTVRDWCPYLFSLQKGIHRFEWLLFYYVFLRVMHTKEIHFVANSNYTYNCINSSYPEKDVDIIPNPILKELILKTKNYTTTSPVFVAISQSIDDVRKNYISLLKAFKIFRTNHSDAKLYIIAQTSDSVIQNWERQNLLENVVLTGQLPHDSVVEQLDRSSCLVHPSVEETFGNILLEAMARRIPCIGGRSSGAVPAVLGYGKYGLLCDVCDPESIAKTMEKAIRPDVSEGIISQATDYLNQNYSNDIVAKKHIVLYQKFLNS